MSEQRDAYLALTQVPGLGPARLQILLDACHTPLGAHSAPFAFLCTLPGMTSACATAIKQTPLVTGRRLAEAVERLGATILVPDDPAFPSLLRFIPDPPPVLFALGDLSLLERPALAVVGSRDHTTYGEAVARTVAGAGRPGRPGRGERHGAGARRGGAHGRARRGRHHDRRPRERPRRHLPGGQPAAVRAGRRTGTAVDGVSTGRAAASRELSPSEPPHQRPGTGHDGGRGRARIRRAHHGRYGTRSGARGDGRPGDTSAVSTGCNRLLRMARRRISSRRICSRIIPRWPSCRSPRPWRRTGSACCPIRSPSTSAG